MNLSRHALFVSFDLCDTSRYIVSIEPLDERLRHRLNPSGGGSHDEQPAYPSVVYVSQGDIGELARSLQCGLLTSSSLLRPCNNPYTPGELISLLF